MKRQSKLVIGITAGMLLVAVVVIIAVLMASSSDSKKYARHMEAAQRYMDELDYEQAIVEYRAAIEIEPNNVEAYQALAEIYVQTGDYEAAIAVLNQGIGQTGSEELAVYIEEVQAAYEELQVLAEASAQEEKTSINNVRIQEEQPKEIYEEQGSSVEASVREEEQIEIEQEEVHPDQEVPQEEMRDSQENTARNGEREETVYNDDGSYIIYEYDANGHLVKEALYKAGGTLDEYWIYEYDADGNYAGETVYHGWDNS